MCRREGVSLCGRDRCAAKRRPTTPGVHGPAKISGGGGKSRLSSYGTQLREKQKAKRLYNVMERQFRRYVEEASRNRGNTSESLVQLLEMRLDNVVYRLGWAKTRRQARQIVGHGFVRVNEKTVDIPSFRARVGDVVSIKETKKEKGIVKSMNQLVEKHETPSWLVFDRSLWTGKVTGIPQGEELRQVFDPTLIVEFYSR